MDPDGMPTRNLNERERTDLQGHTAAQGFTDVLSEMLERLRVPFDQTTFTDEMRSLFARSEFLQDLDRVRDAFNGITTTEKTYVASSIAVSTGLSIGYVIWLLRSGVLLTALLSSVPAWQFVNPLLVLARPSEKKRQQGSDDLEEDSLESMFENRAVPAETSRKAGSQPKSPTFRWPWRT
jgi:hypothetical protein